MSYSKRWLSATGKVCAGLLISVRLSACATTESWKEQVLLHNGRTIVLTRTLDLSPADGVGYRKPLNETDSFTLPGSGKRITWKTSFNDSTRKPDALSPMLVDIVRGTPYLVSMPNDCISYNKWHRPNPPYIAFKFQAGQWVRISVTALPAVLVHSNLIDPPRPGKVKAFYTLQDVENQLQQGNVKDAMKVFRKPIPTEFMRCPVLVPIIGGGSVVGWKTPGPFPSIKSLRAPRQPHVQNKPSQQH